MIYQNILSTHYKGIKKPELLPLFARGGGGGRRFRLKYSFESLKEYTIVLNPRQAGGGRRELFKYLTTGAPFSSTLLILHLTTSSSLSTGGGRPFGITLYNESECSRCGTSVKQQLLVFAVHQLGLGAAHIWLLPLQLRRVCGVSF